MPGDYQSQPEEARRASELARRADDEVRQKAEADARTQRDQAREIELRAAWEELSASEREAILATVKADNPGLSRWKNMLEPLCLAALENQIRQTRNATSQAMLFSDSNS